MRVRREACVLRRTCGLETEAQNREHSREPMSRGMATSRVNTKKKTNFSKASWRLLPALLLLLGVIDIELSIAVITGRVRSTEAIQPCATSVPVQASPEPPLLSASSQREMLLAGLRKSSTI